MTIKKSAGIPIAGVEEWKEACRILEHKNTELRTLLEKTKARMHHEPRCIDLEGHTCICELNTLIDQINKVLEEK